MVFSASYVEEMMTAVQQKPSFAEQSNEMLAQIAKDFIEGKSTRQKAVSENPLDPNAFLNDIAILRKRIDDELKERQFFALETKMAQYFERPYLFGDEVFNNFPSANEDISEAGTCLALERATACVMHLMRVVEAGLKALANQLGLPSRNDWGKHLEDIETELERRYKAAKARTPDEQFFSEAAAQIGHIKTAWRNPTMHVDRSYSPERAEEILVAVRSFMKHLATKLRE